MGFSTENGVNPRSPDKTHVDKFISALKHAKNLAFFPFLPSPNPLTPFALQGYNFYNKWGKVVKGVESMFIGEYQHNMDVKGRVAVPAKFRNKLSGGAIVTRGLDKCLFLFSAEEWEKLAEKIISLPLTQADSRAFSRLMLAGAADCEIDAQGRILIPDYLRKYAGLEKEVVVAGLYNRAEIWDMARWNGYKAETEEKSEEIAERMGELGL
jgi:MraZ protein